MMAFLFLTPTLIYCLLHGLFFLKDFIYLRETAEAEGRGRSRGRGRSSFCCSRNPTWGGAQSQDPRIMTRDRGRHPITEPPRHLRSSSVVGRQESHCHTAQDTRQVQGAPLWEESGKQEQTQVVEVHRHKGTGGCRGFQDGGCTECRNRQWRPGLGGGRARAVGCVTQDESQEVSIGLSNLEVSAYFAKLVLAIFKELWGQRPDYESLGGRNWALREVEGRRVGIR